MQVKLKVILLLVFCAIIGIGYGEMLIPVSTQENFYQANKDFGLVALKFRFLSNAENNTSLSNPQKIQAEMDYNQYSSFPEWSKVITFKSAQEFQYIDIAKEDDSRQEFNSLNTIGVKSKLAGVEAFYNLIKNWDGVEAKSGSYNLTRYGIGAGFPDSESLRLFGWFMHTDLSDIYPDENYSSYKFQLIKRYSGKKQITELGMEYEYNEIPDEIYGEGLFNPSDYFPESYLDWTPKTRLNAYLFASNLQNFYLEPYFMNGHAPVSSPLLLVNETSGSILCRFSTEDKDNDYTNSNENDFDGIFSLNIGTNFGFDMGYNLQKYEDHKNDAKTIVSNIKGDFRIAFLAEESYKLVGILEYIYSDLENESDPENLNTGIYADLRMANHLNIIIYLKLNNEWQRKKDLLEFDHLSNKFGTVLSVRL